MRPETRQSMEMLFGAKWNLPKAAKNCNLTDKEMKITFNEYCAFHPQPTMKVPNWQHHSKKEKKRTLKPQAIRAAKKRLQALKNKLGVWRNR